MVAEIPDEWFQGKCLKPGDVAEYFGVDRTAVTRWAMMGTIGFIRLPNGDRRYPEAEIRRMVRGEPPPAFLKELAEADIAQYEGKGKALARRNQEDAELLRQIKQERERERKRNGEAA